MLDFIEEFPEKLAQITGTDGGPLGYVIREDEVPPLTADGPMFGEPDCRYPSARDEVMARAPIGLPGGRSYSADNKYFFEILRDAIAEHDDVKVWIKGFVRATDGRGAWAAFKAHYLRTSQLDNIAERADLKIETCVYTGEKSSYSFETHMSIFKKAHLDLQVAGNEPDGRSVSFSKASKTGAPDSSRCSTEPRQVSYRLRRNYLIIFVALSCQCLPTVL
jgi:hypothetical protein